MDIDYELYKVFYHVAKTLSFSEAASELFISQSAVSQSIKTLEKRLDLQLFLRSTKKVMLTKEGEILFKHIEPAVKLIVKGENKILASRKTGDIELRVGASDTICRYYLMPFFKSFHEQFPDISLKVMNGTSKMCANLLESGQVDLIITNSPNEAINDTMKYEALRDFKDVFYANKEFFPFVDKEMGFKELSKLPLLMLESRSTTSEYLHEQFLKKSLELVPSIELASNDQLIDLAKIGLGIAFVPDYMIDNRKDKDMYVLTVKDKMPTRRIIAAYDESSDLSQPARFFLDSLKVGL
ncbi:MAG: LysR family transcriptional regulator [Lachnospiraceae bacterium]|nr:LysR family transcriptional regulator [Lachnospiraceae bacterium]